MPIQRSRCRSLLAPLLAPWAFLLLGACGGSAGPGPAGAPPGPPGPGARVTLLQTTDLHHHAQDAGGSGSYARIAAYVESVRASAGHPVLLVDSGDWSMGTLEDFTLGTRPLALLFLDALRYDCVTLGNHEFDHSGAGLAGMLEAARHAFRFRTPIVASNLDPDGTDALALLVGPGRPIQPARVQVLDNGLRVGFLGLMGRDAALDTAGAARFRDWSGDAGFVQALVDDLRGRQGCHMVVALDHAGTDPDGASGEDVELARRVKGIDVIASGHTHHPLAPPRAVSNGGWTTWIASAGCFGSHVSRLDLVYRGPGGAALESSELRPMTDASLDGLVPPAAADPAYAFLVGTAERGINRAFAPLAARLAPEAPFDPEDPAGGIRRPIGRSDVALTCLPGAAPESPGPNGMGAFCADALRAAANRVAGAGAPFRAGAVASGVLRGRLGQAGPISLADLFEVMPLGLSLDPAHDPVPGTPLVSAWLEPEGVRALCALQLLGQAGLGRPDDYLNLSGLAYGLRPEPCRNFFAAAGAALALERTRRRAASGSVPAGEALAALGGGKAPAALGGGTPLEALAAAGNPYARVLAANPALPAVASAAAADAAGGGSRLERHLFSLALEAIGGVAGFAPGDPACTGPAEPLPPGRTRVVLDLDAVIGLDRIQARFGIPGGLYREAAGPERLSWTAPAGREALQAACLRLAPAGPGGELKAWMALALYLTTAPERGGHFQDGRITGEYAADPGVLRFPEAGAAVRLRNASYPRAAILELGRTLAALDGAP